MRFLEKMGLLSLLFFGVWALAKDNGELFVMSVVCFIVCRYIVKEMKNDHTQRA